MADSLLDCPVCLETFQDPHLLAGCGHSFCSRCIAALRSRRCPTCRAPFQPRDVKPNFALRLVLQDVGQPHVTSPSSAEAQARRPGLGSIARSASGSLDSEDDAINVLAKLGLPWGLARLIHEEDSQISLRIFLLDNSGSTAATDGHVLVTDARGQSAMACCSRWEEIRRMALHQARFNARVGTPCEFMLLNPSCRKADRGAALRPGVDVARVDPCIGSVETQLADLERLLASTLPRGPTPLEERLEELYRRIQGEQEELAQSGRRVTLCIATDGLPTGEYSGRSTDVHRRNLVRCLRKLTGDLPVHVIVRLTTDDDDVVKFYNSLDEEEELPLEVLDDLESEAKEIASQGNRWFVYSPVIHSLREGGTFVKLFDLLDERKLTPTETLLLARMLLQSPDEAPPSSPNDFVAFAERRLPNVSLVYDPVRGHMAPCMDLRALRSALVPRRPFFGLFQMCSRRRRPAPYSTLQEAGSDGMFADPGAAEAGMVGVIGMVREPRMDGA